MATQVKPKGSGSFVTITLSATGCCSKSSTGIAALGPGNAHQALRAVNEWRNAGGSATAALRAQKTASANGIQLQEV